MNSGALPDFRLRNAENLYRRGGESGDGHRDFSGCSVFPLSAAGLPDIWGEMNNIVKEYDKIGKRNRKKDDNHLNKHAMHLIRLFMMAIDILEKEEIITYRKDEHELLMKIRRGEFQKEDGTYRTEFYEILADYEKRLHEAAENTSLPDEPDYERVQEFVMSVNERVVRDEI